MAGAEAKQAKAVSVLDEQIVVVALSGRVIRAATDINRLGYCATSLRQHLKTITGYCFIALQWQADAQAQGFSR